MNTNPRLRLALMTILMITACSSPSAGPPKTLQENEAEARAGKIPDNVRDTRPAMPPMGPLSMPMR